MQAAVIILSYIIGYFVRIPFYIHNLIREFLDAIKDFFNHIIESLFIIAITIITSLSLFKMIYELFKFIFSGGFAERTQLMSKVGFFGMLNETYTVSISNYYNDSIFMTTLTILFLLIGVLVLIYFYREESNTWRKVVLTLMFLVFFTSIFLKYFGDYGATVKDCIKIITEHPDTVLHPDVWHTDKIKVNFRDYGLSGLSYFQKAAMDFHLLTSNRMQYIYGATGFSLILIFIILKSSDILDMFNAYVLSSSYAFIGFPVLMYIIQNIFSLLALLAFFVFLIVITGVGVSAIPSFDVVKVEERGNYRYVTSYDSNSGTKTTEVLKTDGLFTKKVSSHQETYK